jgi:Tfp pilus assembly protein PilE
MPDFAIVFHRDFPMFQRFQRGFTLGGFIMLLILALIVGILALKIVPMYMEFNSVKSAMEAVKAEKYDSSKAVRESLMKRLSMNYVESVESDDITISTNDGSYDVSVDYYVDKPLAYNLSMSAHFEYEVTTAN